MLELIALIEIQFYLNREANVNKIHWIQILCLNFIIYISIIVYLLASILEISLLIEILSLQASSLTSLNYEIFKI